MLRYSLCSVTQAKLPILIVHRPTPALCRHAFPLVRVQSYSLPFRTCKICIASGNFRLVPPRLRAVVVSSALQCSYPVMSRLMRAPELQKKFARTCPFNEFVLRMVES